MQNALACKRNADKSDGVAGREYGKVAKGHVYGKVYISVVVVVGIEWVSDTSQTL